MAHEFVVLRNGRYEKYVRYEDIPLDFQHLIRFVPDTPQGPHTEEEHDEIDSWNDKLQRLIDIEKRNNASRTNSTTDYV
jgi:hypothetical protein